MKERIGNAVFFEKQYVYDLLFLWVELIDHQRDLISMTNDNFLHHCYVLYVLFKGQNKDSITVQPTLEVTTVIWMPVMVLSLQIEQEASKRMKRLWQHFIPLSKLLCRTENFTGFFYLIVCTCNFIRWLLFITLLPCLPRAFFLCQTQSNKPTFPHE